MMFFTNAVNALTGHGPAKILEGTREFLAQSALRALLEKTGDPNEDFMRSEMLLIFDTSSQHTWLLASNAALYCIIDNRRQPHARKLWRLARSDIERDNRLILAIIEAELTDRDSYVIIGRQRPRKFTKNLFATLSVKKSIENMLLNAFQLQIESRVSV